jgi:hypothetical protein
VSGRTIKKVAPSSVPSEAQHQRVKRAEYSTWENGRNLLDRESKKIEFPQLQTAKLAVRIKGLFDRRTICRKSSDLKGKTLRRAAGAKTLGDY